MNLRHLHGSLKHDAAPALVAGWLAETLTEVKATSLTTTESQNPLLVKRLRVELPAWHFTRRGEFILGVLLTALRPLDWWPPKIVTLTDTPGLPEWRETRLARRWYVGRDGSFVQLLATHYPAGVENGDHYRRDAASQPAVKASRAALAATGRVLAAGQRPGRTQILGADYNLDQRRPPWREHTREHLGARGLWDEVKPTRGTHGSRLIDGVHVKGGRITGGRVLTGSRPKGIDHAPVLAIVNTR